MRSIYSILVKWFEVDPSFELISYKKKYTINDILNQIEAVSRALKYFPDDFVAIYLQSPVDIFITYLSCINERKVPMLFNSKWSHRDLDTAINQYKVKNIISEWEHRDYKNKNVNAYFFEELVNSSRGCAVLNTSKKNYQYESVLFTSGTSGFSKAVCLSRENFFYSAEAWNKKINFKSDDQYILMLPSYHISGLSILYRAIYYNFKINIIDNYKYILETDGTIISLTPSILNRIIDDPEYLLKLKTFRAIIMGGEPSSLELIRKCKNHDLSVFLSYGMTETCSGIAGYWLSDHSEDNKFAGIPFDGVDIGFNKSKIMIDSKMNMFGYFKKRATIGPFITDDIGYLDENKLFIERRDDSILSGGEIVSISYVKKILLKNENINYVNIKVVQDKKWGQSMVVEFKTDNLDFTISMLVSWCKTMLPSYAIPKVFKII